jgi:hypothetical protein
VSSGYGNIIPYTGLENKYEYLPQDLSGVKKVDEITVDDFMSLLIDALDNDKDVYTHQSEITTDPILGKEKFSSGKGGINYIDPWIFIKQIYGNPYGMSLGQYGYGGQGFPLQNHGWTSPSKFFFSFQSYYH